ncbi:MAG: HEPN domain-containing protein [candidate division WOR-3 bacterium]|nr:HEPN domain-containing protein [candidate division WOR-3 bacterium]
MRIDLAKYRMEKAKEILKESEDAFAHSHLANSVNRSYYAMFTAARALLALKEKDSSKHSGVIALFNQYIVKVGLLPREFSKFLRDAKRLRENSDYGDFVEISKEDAQIQLQNAKEFVQESQKTLQKMIENPQ